MTTSPLRKAINRHLWQRHDRFASNGSTENRVIQHEMLHAKGNCDHTHEAWDDDPSNFTMIEVSGPMTEGSAGSDRSEFIGRE